LYDVIIVGAGPIGSYTAFSLARSGYKVAVFEAKETIGSKVCCTGIISQECYDRFCPENTPVLRKVSSAKFLAPSGQCLRLEKDAVQAYIIDRATLDQNLARKAQEGGVDYLLQSKVIGVKPEGEYCRVEANCRGQSQEFKAKAIVLACGFGSILLERLGMSRIRGFVSGAQAEVNTESSEVEVYFDQELAPGGFAWLVPTSDGKGLAGVMCRHSAPSFLKSLLSRLMAQGKISSKEFEIKQKAIPLKSLPQTYKDRVLVVGEAAGQVKPTTGGGIYFGLLWAELAVNTLYRAFSIGDFSSRQLSHYQKKWQNRIGFDLHIGYLARKIYDKMSNSQIEQVFDIVKKDKIHEQLLNGKDFSFDFHGKLLSRVLRQPKLLTNLVTLKLLLSVAGIYSSKQGLRAEVQELDIAYGK